MKFARLVMLLPMLYCSGCVGTVVGTAVDVTTEVIKVPFRVAGAVVDVATGDEGEKK